MLMMLLLFLYELITPRVTIITIYLFESDQRSIEHKQQINKDSINKMEKKIKIKRELNKM